LVAELLRRRRGMVHLWRADLDAAFGRARGLWAPRWRDSFLRGQSADAAPLTVAAKGLRSPASSTGDLSLQPSAASSGRASRGSPFVAAAVAAAASAAAAPAAALPAGLPAAPLALLGTGAAAHDGADIRSRFMLAHDTRRRFPPAAAGPLPAANASSTRASPAVASRRPGAMAAGKSNDGRGSAATAAAPGRPEAVGTDAALARAMAARDAAVAQAYTQGGAFAAPATASRRAAELAAGSKDGGQGGGGQEGGCGKGASYALGDEVVAWGLVPLADGKPAEAEPLSPGSANSGESGTGGDAGSDHGKSSSGSESPEASGAVVVVVGRESAVAGWHDARVAAVATAGSVGPEVTAVAVTFADARVRPALSHSGGSGGHGGNAVFLPPFLVQRVVQGADEGEETVKEEGGDDEKAASDHSPPPAPFGSAVPSAVPPPPLAEDSPPGKRGGAIVIDEVKSLYPLESLNLSPLCFCCCFSAAFGFLSLRRLILAHVRGLTPCFFCLGFFLHSC
jgi:hypothetical protein